MRKVTDAVEMEYQMTFFWLSSTELHVFLHDSVSQNIEKVENAYGIVWTRRRDDKMIPNHKRHSGLNAGRRSI